MAGNEWVQFEMPQDTEAAERIETWLRELGLEQAYVLWGALMRTPAVSEYGKHLLDVLGFLHLRPVHWCPDKSRWVILQAWWPNLWRHIEEELA